MWPFRRSRTTRHAGAGAPTAGTHGAAEPPAWTFAAPVQRTFGAPASTFKIGAAVREDLVALRPTRLSRSLGHRVSPTAPSGLVRGLVLATRSLQRAAAGTTDLPLPPRSRPRLSAAPLDVAEMIAGEAPPEPGAAAAEPAPEPDAAPGEPALEPDAAPGEPAPEPEIGLPEAALAGPAPEPGLGRAGRVSGPASGASGLMPLGPRAPGPRSVGPFPEILSEPAPGPVPPAPSATEAPVLPVLRLAAVPSVPLTRPVVAPPPSEPPRVLPVARLATRAAETEVPVPAPRAADHATTAPSSPVIVEPSRPATGPRPVDADEGPATSDVAAGPGSATDLTAGTTPLQLEAAPPVVLEPPLRLQRRRALQPTEPQAPSAVDGPPADAPAELRPEPASTSAEPVPAPTHAGAPSAPFTTAATSVADPQPLSPSTPAAGVPVQPSTAAPVDRVTPAAGVPVQRSTTAPVDPVRPSRPAAPEVTEPGGGRIRTVPPGNDLPPHEVSVAAPLPDRMPSGGLPLVRPGVASRVEPRPPVQRSSPPAAPVGPNAPDVHRAYSAEGDRTVPRAVHGSAPAPVSPPAADEPTRPVGAGLLAPAAGTVTMPTTGSDAGTHSDLAPPVGAPAAVAEAEADTSSAVVTGSPAEEASEPQHLALAPVQRRAADGPPDATDDAVPPSVEHPGDGHADAEADAPLTFASVLSPPAPTLPAVSAGAPTAGDARPGARPPEPWTSPPLGPPAPPTPSPVVQRVRYVPVDVGGAWPVATAPVRPALRGAPAGSLATATGVPAGGVPASPAVQRVRAGTDTPAPLTLGTSSPPRNGREASAPALSASDAIVVQRRDVVPGGAPAALQAAGTPPPPLVLSRAPDRVAVVQRRLDAAADAAVAAGVARRAADGALEFHAPPPLQRAEQAAPADVAPAPAPRTAVAEPPVETTPALGAPPEAAATPADLDELAKKLYDRIRWRLRTELRLDMERAGRGAGLAR